MTTPIVRDDDLANRAMRYAERARAEIELREWWHVTLALTDETFEIFFCPAQPLSFVSELYPGATVAPMEGPSP